MFLTYLGKAMFLFPIASRNWRNVCCYCYILAEIFGLKDCFVFKSRLGATFAFKRSI